jgi:hypothetical protein
MRRRTPLLALLLALPVLAPPAARAQWPTDPAVDLPVCTAPGAQDQSRLVGMGDASGVAMVWRDARNAATKGTDIYAQRFDLDGVPQWPANGVAAVDTALNQTAPVAASTGSHLFVAWVDDRNSDVYAQMLDAAGNRLWGPNGKLILSHPGILVDLTLTPTSRADGSGGYRQVFMLGARVAYFGFVLHFGQRIEDDGALPWGLGGLALTTNVADARQIFASSLWDSSVVFSAVQGGSVFAERVALDGTKPWGASPKLLASAALNGTNMIGAYVSPNGNIFNDAFALVGNGTPAGGGSSDDVFAFRLDSGGNPRMGSGITVCTAAGLQAELVGGSANFTGTQDARAFWSDTRSGDWRLYAQFIQAGAPALTPDGVRVCTAETTQRRPRITIGHDFGNPTAPVFRVVVWRDGRGGLYAQALSEGDGALLWDAAGVPISTAAGAGCEEIHLLRLVLPDVSARFVVSHQRSPGGSSDLYLKCFNAAGAFANLDVPRGASTDGAPRLLPVAPNPLRGAGRVRFVLPQAGYARIELVDVAGRRVLTLADGRFDEGVHAIGLDDVRTLAPGLYLVRLSALGRTVATKVVVGG